MAFLDYLLGGVSGGFEGYERKKANELKAKQDEEERQIRLASLFSQGFEPVADVQRKKQAAVGAAGSMAMTALNSVLGGAPRAVPSMADQEALMQGYATAKPERTIAFGGQQLALRETAAERQERQARAEDMQRRRDAEAVAQAARKAKEAEAAAKQARIQALVDSGIERNLAIRAVELDAKYGDISETPSVAATKRGQDITAKTARERLAFDREKEKEGGSEIQSGLQAMGAARAKTALNLLGSNIKSMDAYEDQLLSNKESFNFAQLEAARLAASGKPGSAAAEAALAKMGTGGAALYRYVRSGKAIANAVREITPRGGSNAMMQMEIVLSGIGPAGIDPESISQVRAFRNDLYEGVKTGVDAMTKKSPKANPYR
jgi:hypothetical protein